ncbi:unannotated protein [freshwater metagenome]|uniref:Unannotated protein n=1 Tax=freshwater metagenome TaxID=449393 RepID=A0A6J7HJB2_9ZZZZ|nr:hypothetical protein [Actinomycetota bacterium]
MRVTLRHFAAPLCTVAVAAALLAGGAQAVHAAPLRLGPIRDRILPPGAARAAQAGTLVSITTPSGVTLPVTIDTRLGAAGTVAAQRYADILDGLPHGDELAELRMTLVPSAEVNARCGGSDSSGILACYSPSASRMILPGDGVDPAGGYSIEYVLTHEYGHHIAANRSNAPMTALDYGPKRWSSYELVCDKVGQGRLFPGDQGANYLRDPGESWAETYARLTYPDEPWRFSTLLEPDAGALVAASLDVSDPWTGGKTRTFRSTLTRSGATSRSFAITLRLDGRLAVRLHGPRGAQYDLRMSSLGVVRTRTRTRGAQDSIVYGNACREAREERVTLTVLRRSGSRGGAFRLTVAYAG